MKETIDTLLLCRKHLSSVLRLIEYGQRFFDPHATQEILDEFLPKFTTHSVSNAIMAQGYLVLFLPTAIPRHSITHQPMAQDAMAPSDYLPTIFTLWSIFTCSSTYDAQFTDMLARIAEDNVDTHTHRQVGIFTKDQVKQIFTVCLRMMNLPVGSRSDGGGSMGSGATGGSSTGYGNNGLKVDIKAGNSLFLRRKPKFRSLARFMVYTMFPERGDASNDTEVCYTLDLLRDLIQAIELYYHPSNHGSWSYYLTTFARHLAAEFLRRWREEQEEDCQTPAERRLTPTIRDQFVLILRPVTYLSMFGKDQYTVGASQSTLKYLSWIQPSLIFPGLLERIYPSLETLTETHRTSSALSILADTALPLFSRDHYPAGGKHLLPLLHLALPGIDMNDPIKTIASLMFIANAVMSIPVVDLADSESYYNPAVDYSHQREGMDLDADQDAELSREMEDQLCRATTGEFEEWLAKFMRRVFTIFENLPQHDRKKQSGAMEAGLTQTLLHACDIVFGQLSEPLYDLALRMVVDFASEQVLPNAVRATGMLCDSITSANPQKAAKRFFPLCINNIMVELEHGASSTITNSSTSNPIQSDSSFHWYQNILFSVVSMMGSELLRYKKDILAALKEMVSKCRSRRGIMWTGKVLRNCLRTLLETYPMEFRSATPREWADKEYMGQSYKTWGKPGDPAALEIQWHTPSDEEKAFASELLDTFLDPSLTRLQELMTDNALQDKPSNAHALTNEFCRHLAVIRNCLIGSWTMVEDDGMDDASVDDDSHTTEENALYYGTSHRLVAGYAFTDFNDPRTQKARSYRKRIGELIHQAAIHFKTERENDVESIKILIKICRTFLSERGVEKLHFERSKSSYSYAKNICRTPLCHKRYPRHLLVRRAYNLHLLRLRQNTQGRLRTTLHDALLRDLLDFSLSAYPEIRKMSQSALPATARNFLGSKSIIIPVLLEALQPQTNVEASVASNRMKGSLYLLTHKSILMACLRDWRYIPKFITTLCQAQHEDKISIQELIRKIYLEYVTYFSGLMFRVLSPDDMDEVLKGIAPVEIEKSEYIHQKVEERESMQMEAYRGLVDDLLSLLQNDRMHWRFAAMAANFLELFLKPELAPTAALADFANKCTLSELPPLRRTGVEATSRLLLYIKQRTFARGNEDLFITHETRNPLKYEVTVGKDTLHSAPQLLGASPLIDSTVTGWYVWPASYEAYAPCTSESLFAEVDEASQGAFDRFRVTFTSESYWKKLLEYMSQEFNQKQEDCFGVSHGRFYVSIFQMFQDEPIATVRPVLEELCYSADQKSRQRAAAELTGGIIRGSKHWNSTKKQRLWDWIIPVLRKTLANITPDCLSYWESFVRFCAANRDPRRIRPLIDLILEAEFDPSSDAAFSESRKLLLIRALITSLKWRSLPVCDAPLSMYMQYIQHPYKQVREVIGGNINSIMQIQWVPSAPSVADLIQSHHDGDGVGNVPTHLQGQAEQQLSTLMKNMDQWWEEAQSQPMAASSHFANASKTVLCWLHAALTQWRVAGTLALVVPFLPRIFQMQEINDDQDLQQMAGRVLRLMAQVSYPPSMVCTMIDQFVAILTTSSSWHMRIRALPILQIFYFKHLFVMNSDQVLRIMSVISSMLLDSQIEVRQLASVTLGGLVRCSQRDAISMLRARYSKLLNTKIPKLRRDIVTGKAIEPAGYGEAILQKHAGALGLSCLVSAFPYEVPKWMPDVLCQLASCQSDPAEIQATIRKTFSDFRRTHSDTWHEDMNQFDEDQLSILNDMLISPSYYA
ncbi:uncharacterized protein BYT42DRAFT_495617 [Radiomyces spectabilis]|uniref:uncharacterized protein n=1 Tax=Radiomyces spectabilis TaxID=64574 RepID=UPI00222056EF|nr:uncharacterized protein BYT42DRAFT_495617 [Radiomyces spectabilis]KAI8379085.1 hypothetical protein BYT42DRAFT_495617 [Radiomyces spectabilis]